MNFFDLFLGIAFIAMAVCYIMWAVEDSRNDEKVRMWISIGVAVASFIAGILNIATVVVPILPG